MTYGYAACSPRVMWVIRGELGLHLQSSNRVLAPSLTIAKKGLSKSTPGCAACSSKVMRIIREELGLHLQSSNRVLALSHRGKGTFRVYPWMRRVLPKGHLGCPRGTRPPSSIVESSTRPVFDHRGKETLRVYPWMCCVLPKGHVAYPGGPWLLLSIVEPSTFTVFVASRKELSKSPLDAPRAL